HVDAYVLDLLAKRTFRASDFHETRRGVCRLLEPTTHKLAETAPTWGKLIAPAAEQVARTLADAPGSRIERIATPLTSTNRHAARAAVRKRPRPAAPPARPKVTPEGICQGCGGEVPHRERVYCDTCLPDVPAGQAE